MNNTSLLAVIKKIVSSVILLSASHLFAATQQCHETNLYNHMGDIRTELKTLSFEIKKENYSVAQESVKSIVQLLDKSKQETPFLFLEKGLKGDALNEQKNEYQKAISGLITVFMALDSAIESKDAGQVRTLMKEVGQARKLGHRKFKAEC